MERSPYQENVQMSMSNVNVSKKSSFELVISASRTKFKGRFVAPEKILTREKYEKEIRGREREKERGGRETRER